MASTQRISKKKIFEQMRDQRSEAQEPAKQDPKRRIPRGKFPKEIFPQGKRSPFSITTAIPYMNGDLHLGHTLEFVETDCIARYHRLMGQEVYFLTGTDEHGQKNLQTAEKLGIPVRTFVSQNVKKFRELLKRYEISHDDFIRTTDKKRHWPSVQKIWKQMLQKGDIYKGVYKGLYCVGCEEFKLEKDLVNGLCPSHEKVAEYVEQENYFFRLSKYSKKIANLLKKKAVRIVPEFRANEIIALCERGLEDVSFSRPKTQLSWGIPVPGDEKHVMYVWCDALTNYISAMDYARNGKVFRKFWPVDAHVIGKDILRFHAGIWLGMLLSAGLPLPKYELVHGWLHYQGKRMSKTLGTIVDPHQLAEHYGIETVRYYLLSEVPVGLDGDFTYRIFESKINADLSNNLGNFVNRVLSMVEKYTGGKVPQQQLEIPDLVEDLWEDYHLSFAEFDHQKACKIIIDLVNFGNKLIADEKPWELSKQGKEKELGTVLRRGLKILLHVGFMLSPMLPEKSREILKAFGLENEMNTKTLKQLMDNTLLKKIKTVKKIPLLFDRIELERSWVSRDEKVLVLPKIPLPVSEEAMKLGLPVVSFIMTGLKPLGTAVEKRLKKQWEQWIEALRNRPDWEQKSVQKIIDQAYELNTRLGISREEIPGNALLQQFLADPSKPFPFINPIVAIYNFIEAKYGFSLGAHDLEKLKSDAVLKICDGSEQYFPLGAVHPRKVPPGTYAYCDDEGRRVICWLEVKQGQETAVTDKTTAALFILQGYPGIPLDHVQKAGDELKGLLEEWLA